MAVETLVKKLKAFDTCTVSDALDRLGLEGATLGIRPMWPCPRIAGRDGVISRAIPPLPRLRPFRAPTSPLQGCPVSLRKEGY